MAKWRNLTFAVLLVACALLLSNCKREKESQPIQDSETAQAQPADELVVVSTNDFHAALDRAEGLASVIRDLRKKYGERVVYVDAGDQFQGSLEGNTSKGKAVVAFFNLLQLDAAALGNHELDYGPDVPQRVMVRKGEDGMGAFKERVKEATYPFLSANLIQDPPVQCDPPGPTCNAMGQQTLLPPCKIVQRAGKKIGIIGVLTPITANITNPDFLKGERIEPIVPIVTAQARWLREKKKCDWVILVAHEGFRYEIDGKTFKNVGLLPVIKELPPGIVDIIIAGHSHIRIQTVMNGFPIIQTGIGAGVVGVTHLMKKNGKVESRFEPFVPVPDTAVAFDVTSLMIPYRQMALNFKRQVVARTTAPFPQDKTGESALGNLMADAVLDAAEQVDSAQFAVMNAGGIRSGLPEGIVTYDNVFKLMPFSNSLVVAELTGKELTTLLEVAFSGALGPASISGLKVTAMRIPAGQQGPWSRDLNGDGKKEDWERDLLVQATDSKGHQLNDNQIYRLATNTYLVEGGDYQDFVYDRIPESRIHIHYDQVIRDNLVQYFKAQSPLSPTHFYRESKARISYVEEPQS